MWVPAIVVVAALAGWLMDDLPGMHEATADQAVVFIRRDTWVLSWLYLGTFGSLIGFAACFPLVTQTQFAGVDAVSFAFAGPLGAALARVALWVSLLRRRRPTPCANEFDAGSAPVRNLFQEATMRTPASIARHPIHPTIVPIAVGGFVLSFIFDIVCLASGNFDPWATVAYYTMIGGIVAALIAAAFGFTDLLSLPAGETKKVALTHMSINLLVVILFLWNAWLRHGTEETTTGQFILGAG